MNIDRVVAHGTPTVCLAPGSETGSILKAETNHDGTVDVESLELQGVHLEDAKRLMPGQLEGTNLEILSRYLEISPRPVAEADQLVTHYSVLKATGSYAIITYQNPSGRGKVSSVPLSLSETTPLE